MEENSMKAKGIRVIANLILWVGVIACLGGFILALLLSMGNPIGLPTEYVPDQWCYITLGLVFAVVLIVGIILHVVAGNKEKREQIRACMEAVEEATVLDAEEEIEEVVEEEIPEEVVAVEETEAPAEEAPKTKYQIVRETLIAKTPITEEQLDKAEKVGKVAIPVAAACTVVLMVAKLASYRKGEIRRRTFYNWLG